MTEVSLAGTRHPLYQHALIMDHRSASCPQSKHRHFYWKCTASQLFDGQGSLNNITRIRNSGKCTPGEQVLLNREF